MQVIDALTEADLREPSFVTVGSYDGIHIGHQHLLGQMQAAARDAGARAALVTFHPRPQAVLAPHLPARYLTTPAEKIELLRALGLDLVAILPFTRETARTPAADFVRGLVDHLRMQQLWVGPDFALGRNREGDVPALGRIGQDMGYTVHVVEPQMRDGEVVSSTRIRQLLARGEVRAASALLSRYPAVTGQVTQGAQRGRLLGFPTANLAVSPERAVPADGVYACYAWTDGQRCQAVTNVGVRPSFAGAERTVEAHLLNFNADLYGRDMKLEFVERLRPEKRFQDLNDLVAQIHSDIDRALEILAREPA
jgi:riboflavin kinase/FMN adenylyltransferase